MSRVAVVGAGLAGLSAAAQLMGDGHDVVVLEREAEPGGRAGTLSQDGFTFDTGPTVLTMPHLLDRAFARLGTSLESEVPLRRLDPAYRAVYADGSELLVRAGLADQVAELRRRGLARDAQAFGAFVDWLQDLYSTEMPHFIERNFDSPMDLLTRPSAAARLIRLGGFGSLQKAVAKRIADPRLVRLFTFQAMYAGLAPTDALAIYAVITYMDCISGVYYPEGGMHRVPVALARALGAAGAELRYGAPVTELLTDATGKLAGVVAGGEKLAVDAAVVTLDLPTAYARLLPDLTPPRGLARAAWSPSALVWHVGVKGLPDAGVAHHNIHFAESWDVAFDQLIRRKELMGDPSRLVTVPSLDADVAPDGHSALYVLEPVPHLGASVDWTRERGPARERLHRFLGANGYPDDVVTERLVTPLDWAEQGMAMGTPFSLAHTFGQTGPFRPANVEPRLPGVFFAGSGTTPGVGVPMVLISGELAAERVRTYLGASRPPTVVPAATTVIPGSPRDPVRRAGWSGVGDPGVRRDDGWGLGSSARGSRPAVIPGSTRDPVRPAGRRRGTMTPELTAGYAECARLTRTYGTTYYWGAALLPAAQRRHVYAVYALCRLADDIVDADGATTVRGSATAQQLAAFRAGFAAALAGDPPDATLAAIAHTVHETGIERECFDRFFGAMELDLAVSGYRTWADLCGYMEGSAAVVGEMMLPVLQPLTPDAKAPARALGFAFQLTNFLRDVGEDLDRGRVYLPADDLSRFGADPWRRVVDQPWRELMAFEIARNRELYEEARTGLLMLPPASARCVGTALDLYSRILERIESRGYDVFSGRARVPTWRKAVTAASVLATGPRQVVA